MEVMQGPAVGGRLTDHLSLGVLTATIPRRVVDEVIAETGRGEKRSRLLPAHVVVYFVLALALFRDGYAEVMRALVHGLRFARTWSGSWQVPTSSALTQARARLGEEPLRLLYQRVGRPVASRSTPGAWLGRRRLMAIDGVILDAPDTPANRVQYDAGEQRPYPQVRVVGLGECGTHAIITAAIGSVRQGERGLAQQLTGTVSALAEAERQTDPAGGLLVLADRGFHSYQLWRHYLLTGADLLWRLSDSPKLPVLQVLSDGSYLSEITSVYRGSRTRVPIGKVADPMLATHIPVRVIEYQVSVIPTDQPHAPPPSGPTYRLLTSILDPDDAHAIDLANAYSQRWEFESSLREIECQILASGSTLRSKSPEMVRQEIWGLLLTHYAIRAFMTEAADSLDLDPDRLSTITAINIVRRSVTDPAALSPLSSSQQPPPSDQ